MEAAVRAFEDWEFRVLEQESGIDDEDEGAAEEKHEGSELETELSSQQHVVDAAQVNNTKVVCFFFPREVYRCMTSHTGLHLICGSCASCHRPSVLLGGGGGGGVV